MRQSAIDARATLLLAVWLGLVTAYVELIVLAWRNFYLGWKIGIGIDVVWMAPATYLAIFAAAGMLIVLLGRLRPGLITVGRVVFALSMLSFVAVSFLYARAHKAALILLAAGMAAQVSRLALRRWPQCLRVVRRTAPVLVLVAVALGVAARGGRWMVERRALGALPAAPAEARNVILLILDTVRAESLSLYGYGRPTTPNLERWARRGTVFEWAIAPAPWTLPSHASMFTGRWRHELSAGWQAPLGGRHATLAEVMARHGYATAGFVANLAYCSYESGLDRGFIHYEDFPVGPGQFILSTSLGRAVATSTTIRSLVGHPDLLNRKSAARINRDFLSWLDGLGPRPFFAFLNYFDAHEPYLPPAPFDEMFGPRGGLGELRHKPNQTWREDRWRMPPEDAAGERNAYDGAIAYLDQQVDLLLSELESRGLLRNTIVIIASDHGEQLGEHGLYDHGNSLYMPLLHVPLVVLHPEGAGRRISVPVSLRAIPTTVMDLAGLEQRNPFPTPSLARFWREGPGGAQAMPALSEVRLLRSLRVKGSRPPGQAVSLVAGEHHYIRNVDGSEELYNFRRDPGELVDLMDLPGRTALGTRLRRELDSLLKGRNAAGPVAAGEHRQGGVRERGQARRPVGLERQPTARADIAGSI